MTTDASLAAAIVSYTEVAGYPPTLRELTAMLGLRSPNAVYKRLLRMRAAGVVSWDPQQARTLKVVADGAGAGAGRVAGA